MNYSLWRGNVELGRVRLALSDDDPAMVHGMLEVASDHVLIESVEQVRFERGERAVVFEHAMPDLDTVSTSVGQHFSAASSDGPRVMSPQDAMGVPEDRVLTLRDGNGEIIVCDMISVSRLPVAFTRNKAWLMKCAEAGIKMSPWSVGALRRSLGEEQPSTAP